MDLRVTKAKIELMLSYPFWGSLVTRLELKDWDGDTFATNGKYILVPKPEHYKNWTFKELVGVLAHETWHCAGGHVFRMKDKEQEKWNIAADYATNWLLSQNGFTIPADGLLDKKYEGMTAEKIYGMLPAQPPKCPKDLQQPGGKQGDNKDKNSGKGNNDQNGNDKGQSESEIDPKELEQDWKESLANAARVAKGRGNLPGGMEEYIDSFLFPKVPWQEILYRYLQITKGCDDYTTYPFNRRHIWREIYLPSLRSESIEIVCAIDTSGSISDQDAARYLSEIRAICSLFGNYTIHLFQCDTKINKYDIIDDDSIIPKVIVGRGGTDFRPVFDKIYELQLEELPFVYFTDLDGYFHDKSYIDAIFWLIRKDQNRYKHQVPYGEIIEIDD